MKDNRDLARGWFTKAESDLSTTRWMLDSQGPYDTACFHAQQAVEKALKALLALRGQPIPRTHDLDELQQMCLSIAPNPQLARLDLTESTDYAVALRYDIEFWPEKSTAEEAASLAEQVLTIVHSILGN